MSRLRLSISKRLPRRFALAVSGALLGVATVGAAEPGSENVVAAIQREVHAVFEKCHGAIVRIEAVDAHGHLSGTGFFIDPNGTLYTCYSVGGESQDIRVQFKGAYYPATRLVADSRSGVALLKIGAETPFLASAQFTSSAFITVASEVLI